MDVGDSGVFLDLAWILVMLVFGIDCCNSNDFDDLARIFGILMISVLRHGFR